ncbi:MAG: FdhF/YdeP family oxidoreductase [Chromatiales bacterium]|nr:FdhF/YdeP family oxidoreductase [Chromatiales bacterium]
MSNERDSKAAAGGWAALVAVGRALRREGTLTAGRALLHTNQPDGFDCPGCAWPDPRHTSSFEFCENGAKAVAWEATDRTIDAAFFARHTVSELRQQSDHWLEAQGRLTQPLRYNRASDRYEPIAWDEAFALIASQLRALPSPDAAAFYTSGRTSNEAAFLYQLMIREFGTNNMPDCSNLCHEASSIGLPQSIGVGKGTVTLADFDCTGAVFSFGHNPGTNHPRMLATLQAVARRGKPIVVFNPMRERGLERFRSPKEPAAMLTGASTELATHYFQPRIGSDPLVLQGLMKRLLELDREAGGQLLDHEFITTHTNGYALLREQLESLDWPALCSGSGLSMDEFTTAAEVYLGADSVIAAYGMGITQHRHGTGNVQQIANLLLLGGHIGRPGAGICPVRGHSNVQGDRTMGINERPPADFLDRLEQATGIRAPRESGCTVVECIERMLAGQIRVLISMGGNFAVAAPDPEATHAALGRLDLLVGIHTKLNRSHLLHRGESLILPCLARSDRDVQAGGEQFVTVEDSMSMVHASRGFRKPVSPQLLSEPAIVAGIAQALLPGSPLRWAWLVEDYDRIRELIAEVVPGFGQFNERVRSPGGFHLRNAAAHREWQTVTGRACFIPFAGSLEQAPAAYPLRLTTVRSHDQYNTTIYGHDDRYRGIRGRRDVLFISARDLETLGLAAGTRVDVIAAAGGRERRLPGLELVEYAIAPGSLAAYYPEAMPLISLEAHDPTSRTPAYKSTWVRLTPSASADLAPAGP